MRLNRFISGSPGQYYYQIPVAPYKELSGGYFYRKHEAIAHLETALINYLEDNINCDATTKRKRRLSTAPRQPHP